MPAGDVHALLTTTVAVETQIRFLLKAIDASGMITGGPHDPHRLEGTRFIV